MIKKIVILIIGLWCFAASNTSIHANTVKDLYYENPVEKHAFDDKAWEAAKGEIDFTPPALKKKQEEEAAAAATTGSGTTGTANSGRSQRRSYRGWDPFVGEGTMSGVFKIILIILAVILAAVLVFRLAGGSFEVKAPEKNTNPRDINSTVNIKNIEENLHKSDMEILIDKSLAEGNYMLAVRLYYLWAIKELSNKRLIKWKRDKTNRDYIREMRKTDLNKPFREVTRIFERVWYGSQEELKQTDYLSIQKKLDAFVQQVKRK